MEAKASFRAHIHRACTVMTRVASGAPGRSGSLSAGPRPRSPGILVRTDDDMAKVVVEQEPGPEALPEPGYLLRQEARLDGPSSSVDRPGGPGSAAGCSPASADEHDSEQSDKTATNTAIRAPARIPIVSPQARCWISPGWAETRPLGLRRPGLVPDGRPLPRGCWPPHLERRAGLAAEVVAAASALPSRVAVPCPLKTAPLAKIGSASTRTTADGEGHPRTKVGDLLRCPYQGTCFVNRGCPQSGLRRGRLPAGACRLPRGGAPGGSRRAWP